MSKSKSRNIITSVAIPEHVLVYLRSKARKLSAKLDKDINLADLIRKALIEFYKIKDIKKEVKK